ncbi:hypothetical protein SAMN05216357_1357 [Porphyromonadaceae bacterium KH3CP3RA]|nr:hypothetical protein SAMN05216357_1357 [Porphyromonadaceae bacterium KH3CP3RA]
MYEEIRQSGQEALTQLLKVYEILQGYEDRKIRQKKSRFSLKQIFYNGSISEQDKPTGTE